MVAGSPSHGRDAHATGVTGGVSFRADSAHELPAGLTLLTCGQNRLARQPREAQISRLVTSALGSHPADRECSTSPWPRSPRGSTLANPLIAFARPSRRRNGVGDERSASPGRGMPPRKRNQPPGRFYPQRRPAVPRQVGWRPCAGNRGNTGPLGFDNANLGLDRPEVVSLELLSGRVAVRSYSLPRPAMSSHPRPRLSQ